MRSGTLWRSAVLASLALLMSGQLCMLTTCVPRLRNAHAKANSCCHTAPGTAAPAPAMPAGAMPCDQSVTSAAAPVLDAPSAVAILFAVVPASDVECVELDRSAFTPPDHDTGPAPGSHRPAPTGLRAPPRA